MILMRADVPKTGRLFHFNMVVVQSAVVACVLAAAQASAMKRGLSGLKTCDDATVLGLHDCG